MPDIWLGPVCCKALPSRIIVVADEAMFILETFFFFLFLFLASPEDNGIVLEKEISKEEVVGIIELYKRSSAATETAQLQKIVLQMDKYGVRGDTYCKFSASGEGGMPGPRMPFGCLKREATCVSVVLS